MRRTVSRIYAGVGYLAFLLPIGYLAGFLADVGVPKSVDRGAGPWGPSLAVDLLLLVAFGLQHSVMARPWFKKALSRWVPEGLERSTYVLASGVVLSVVFWLWRPVPLVLWDVSDSPVGTLAWIGFGAGWVMAVWATFALSHLHLFGLAQARAHARGEAPPRLRLRETRLYRIVRHPMTVGLLLIFWSAPVMTLGHAVFAAGMTIYSLVATILEERDLLRDHADRYDRYRGEVPALLAPLRPGLLLPRRGGFLIELALVAGLTLAPFAALRGAMALPDLAVSPDSGLGARALEPGARAPAALETDTVRSAGRARTFDLFDPGSAGDGPADAPSLDSAAEAPGGARPLVLALHGTGGDGARLRTFLGGALERAAAERGWIVAYPDAEGGAWSDCRAARGKSASGSASDDVAFLRALVGHLVATRGADPGRVYVLGYSGGGHMAFRLAFEAPDAVRAVAVFGASPPPPEASTCRPRPGAVDVLMVNGTADRVSPFGGGDVITPAGIPLGPVLPAEEGATALRALSSGRAEVRLVAIEGGGHVVPGPGGRFPPAAGRVVRSYRGVEEALSFFERSGPPERAWGVSLDRSGWPRSIGPGGRGANERRSGDTDRVGTPVG